MVISPDYVDDLEQLVATGREFVTGAQNWRDRRAALLLYHAGLTIGSLKAYDHECRATYEPLVSLSSEWSQADRSNAWDQIQRFTNVHKIYPVLQEHLPVLEEYVERFRTGRLAPIRRLFTPTAQQQAAARLVKAADDYQMLTAAVRYQKVQLMRAWQPIITIQEILEGSPQVRSDAEAMLRPILSDGWRLLDEARAAYGVVQDNVLRRHTRLIQWRQLMIDLSPTPQSVMDTPDLRAEDASSSD